MRWTRSNILAPGFRRKLRALVERKKNASVSQPLNDSPPQQSLPFFPPSPSGSCRTIGHGKSYPVTAAQLLPVFTGFLAPIHFFKLANNSIDHYPFALRSSRQI